MRPLLLAAAALAAAAVSACGSTPPARPTGVAINPVTGAGTPSPSGGASASGSAAASGSASATPIQQSGTRTVITPLGLNVRSQAASDAGVLGSAAQGATLTVLAYSPQNGGWFQVKGATTTGYISADPALSAPGDFNLYQSSAHGFNALYPVSWTFSEGSNNVTFRPQSGTQSILVASGHNVTDFGQAGQAGYAVSDSETLVVCGVTTQFHVFARTPSATAPGPAYLAEFFLAANSTLALAMEYSYDQPSQLPVFTMFYNSVSFMGPQCLFTPSPSASPKP